MGSSSPHSGAAVRRRPFLAATLASIVAPGVASLPAIAAAPTPLEQAVAEVRRCRLVELRHHLGNGADVPCTGQFVMRTLRAVARLRDAAASEGLSPALYRAVLNLALRLGRGDYLEQRPRAGPQPLAA